MVDDRLEERLRIALRVTSEDLDLSVTTAELERRLRLRRRSRTVQRSALIAAVVAVLAIGVAASGTWFRAHTNVGATPSPAPDASLTPPSPRLPAVVPPSAEASGPLASPSSPKGSSLRVRYWDEHAVAHEINVDGTGHRLVPEFDLGPPGFDDRPSSIDGRFVVDTRGGITGIYPTDQGSSAVLEVPGADHGAVQAMSWSPTSDLVVVARGSASIFDPYWIWILDGDHRRVIAGPFTSDRHHDWAWSPDGRSIAVSAHDGLRIVDGATGTVATHQSTIAGDTEYIDLTWSPDGKWIVYQPWAQGPNEIDRVAADGTHGRRLSLGRAPAWSPDSSRIVFLYSPKGNDARGPWQIWSMNVDGRNRRPFIVDGCPCDFVEWSPDGKLLLARERDDLWVVTPDGKNVRRLARNASGTWVTP